MNIPRKDYYQGILQLRDVNEDILGFVHSQIRKREGITVTRTVKFTDGLDLYITSQKFIRILGKKLKDRFGGELKVSAKLHTTNRQGKELYRVNLLFRPLKYRKGDIISIRDEKVRLTGIGKKIFARNLNTGKKMTIRSADLP